VTLFEKGDILYWLKQQIANTYKPEGEYAEFSVPFRSEMFGQTILEFLDALILRGEIRCYTVHLSDALIEIKGPILMALPEPKP
jgi:hypothetical protein